MTEKIIDGIVVDEDSIDVTPEMEPNEYFLEMKGNVKFVDEAIFNKNAEALGKEIEKAHKAGQKTLLHSLAFMWEVVQKELTAAAAGFDKYVYREDVVKLIDNVKPANSIKATDIDGFPRIIPDENLEAIVRAKELGIFDGFVVVYTDLSDDSAFTNQKKKERDEFVKRNTDPVVFGVFYSNTLATRHERMYLITDWEDEFCDLTFAKIVDKISEINGGKNVGHSISVDPKWIGDVINSAKKEIKEATQTSWNRLPQKTFFAKMKDSIKGMFK